MSEERRSDTDNDPRTWFSVELEKKPLATVKDLLLEGGLSPKDQTEELVIDLIDSHINHRRRRGESPSINEYRSQFPHLSRQIDKLFGVRYSEGVKIGQGGLGDVFKVFDYDLEREVARKQVLSQFANSPAHRARLAREAKIIGGFEHPNIVPIHAWGRDLDRYPYYIMRLIRGKRLKDAVVDFHQGPTVKASERRTAFRQLLRYLVAACHAIHYAHGKQVIHCDIKPSNIMLGPGGETQVVDWGLAWKLDELEGPNFVPKGGTAGYMSLEQALGKTDQLGPRSDVFSLGVTLYYILTGKLPFQGDSAEILLALKKAEFLPPQKVDVSIDRALDAICLKAMELKPGDRYASAEALAEEIQRWLDDEPVQVYAEPWHRRLARWGRRHQSWVGAAVTMSLLTTGFAILFVAAVLYQNKQIMKSIQLQDELSRFMQDVSDAHEHRLRSLLAKHIAPELQQKTIDAMNKDLAKDVQDLIAKNTNNFSDYTMAVAYGVVGSLTPDIDPATSSKSLEKASTLLESISYPVISDIIIQLNKAFVDSEIGDLQESLGHYEKALFTHREVRTTLEKLLRIAPETVDFQRALVQTRANTAMILWQLGRRDDAIDEIKWAYSEVQKGLHASSAASVRSEDANGLRAVLGYMEAQMGRRESARVVLRHAYEANDHAEKHNFKYHYIRSCIAAQLGALQGEKGRDLTPAESTERDRLWNEAMAEIREARSKGILGQGTSLSFPRLLLDPLRSREEFQRIEKERAFAKIFTSK